MDTSLEVLKRFLDKTFPEVGLDCPNFPVMVVLFSAAMMRNANPAFLEQFTRYRREFIDAIAANMANNGLWKDDQYLACGWLDEGRLDEEEFAQQVDVATGMLWYTEQAVHRGRVDVLWIRPEIPAPPRPLRCNLASKS
jgi:hypothetical protein